jgi:hypothetical protein
MRRLEAPREGEFRPQQVTTQKKRVVLKKVEASARKTWKLLEMRPERTNS